MTYAKCKKKCNRIKRESEPQTYNCFIWVKHLLGNSHPSLPAFFKHLTVNLLTFVQIVYCMYLNHIVVILTNNLQTFNTIVS